MRKQRDVLKKYIQINNEAKWENWMWWLSYMKKKSQTMANEIVVLDYGLK